MKNFAKIATCYDVKEKLSLEHLASLYANKEYLKSRILELIQSELNENVVRDKQILIKPNFVKHIERDSDKLCLCTNFNLIISLTEILASYKPKKIVIGDAPIQGCNWKQLITDEFVQTIGSISECSKVPISIKDFRRVIFDNGNVKENNPIDNYTIVDIGSQSMLEEITSDENKFRVSDYNPDRLALSHHKGMHKYCIINELFDSDIVITVPKIKTHQKAGFTNAMKILVGVNGDKDFLPHHRCGGTDRGGDCYPGKNILRTLSETFEDAANRSIGKKSYSFLRFISRVLWRLSFPNNESSRTAGWYGNDTCWRMVSDINTISLFGKKDGSLSKNQQRIIYSLCDGIIAGQGNGPLSPDPLPLGVLCFTNKAMLMDVVAARLMGVDVEKIQLLVQAQKSLTEDDIIFINAKESTMNDVMAYSVKAKMPSGWVNYNK